MSNARSQRTVFRNERQSCRQDLCTEKVVLGVVNVLEKSDVNEKPAGEVLCVDRIGTLWFVSTTGMHREYCLT